MTPPPAATVEVLGCGHNIVATVFLECGVGHARSGVPGGPMSGALAWRFPRIF